MGKRWVGLEGVVGVMFFNLCVMYVRIALDVCWGGGGTLSTE